MSIDRLPFVADRRQLVRIVPAVDSLQLIERMDTYVQLRDEREQHYDNMRTTQGDAMEDAERKAWEAVVETITTELDVEQTHELARVIEGAAHRAALHAALSD